MMKRPYTWLAAVLLGAMAAFAGYQAQQLRHGQADVAAAAVLGRQLPEFSLNNLDGEAVPSTIWDGKVRLINFWASWCPPCRREIPGFAEVRGFYHDQGFEVIGIAVDRPADVEAFLAAMPGVEYPQLIGDDDAAALGRALGNPSGGLPYSVLADREGVVRFVRRGELEKEELLEELEALL